MPNKEVTIAVVTMQFDATNIGQLIAVLSKYVVLTRMAAGCRNVDLIMSAIRDNRVLVIQKWESQEVQRAHFDSQLMVTMAESCKGLLSQPPQIELWDSLSAHDLI